MTKQFSAVALMSVVMLAVSSTTALAKDKPTSPAAQNLDDATIFALFDQVNTMDIWAARLALRKAQSEKVRELARMVVHDHEQVQHQARDIANKRGIVLTPPDNNTDADDLARTISSLQSKSGAEFDRLYVSHEVQFHEAAVKATKEVLLPSVHDEELRAFLLAVIPALEEHVKATKQLASEFGTK